MIIKQISFDLDVSVRNTNIGTIKQNNTNSINFVINMVDGGYPVDLSGVTYAMISIKRPNGSVSNSIATLTSNGVVSYLLEPNAVNLTGLYEAEIQLFASGDSLLISSTFYYNIQESLYSDGVVTSQPEYPILVQLISDVTAMEEALAPIAADEATRKSNEIARVSNESSRVTSETARVSAESTRATNESTRQTNETGRVSAESTRVSQENTRVSNETARVSAESSRVTAENNRASNESIRNQGFVTAMGEESERIDNENARILAESGRQSAESIRVTSENARISAESSRASAEIARASNEIIREQFEFKGNYDAGTEYVVNNVVFYNGSSYVCIANSTGNLPTNATYWKMVAQKGADGLGAGDMLKAVYDQDNDGVVDNSERLGGQLPEYFLPAEAYTAADILAKLLTVDVNDAGINATTVQGYTPVNKAGDSMTGALKFNRNDPSVRSYKDALHFSTDGTKVGTLKIKLPKGWSSTMMTGKLMGFGYTQEPWTLDFSGYNYADTTVWLSTYARLNGPAGFSKIRFAYDGTNCCILLGDLTSTWSYLQLVMLEFIAGFQNVEGWETGWSAAILTSETGLTNISEIRLDRSLVGRNETGQVLVANWYASGSGLSDYPAYALFPNSKIKATDRVDFAFQGNYLLTAENAACKVQQTYDGGIKLYAKSIPGGALVFDYTILG